MGFAAELGRKYQKWRRRHGDGGRLAKKVKEGKDHHGFIEAQREDPFFWNRSWESYIELTEQYPEAPDGFITCGVCGDYIALVRMYGCKYDPDREHSIYYVCDECVEAGRIGTIYVPTNDGVWTELEIDDLNQEVAIISHFTRANFDT